MSDHPQGGSLMDKVKGTFGGLGRSGSKERSISKDRNEEEGRGRQQKPVYMSTGRGGAGNIIRSPSRDPKDVAREEAEERRIERSLSRDRQGRSSSRVRMGRGGAGNYVSPTREDAQKVEAERAYEAKVIQAQIARDEANFHSAGRGGAGNMVKEPMDAETRNALTRGD